MGTYCHGVDALNTETQQVTVLIILMSYLVNILSCKQHYDVGYNLHIEYNCRILWFVKKLYCVLGAAVLIKSDIACIRGSWTYLSHNH